MFKNARLFIFGLIISLVAASGDAVAQADNNAQASLNNRCVDLIKECFAYSDTQRSDCFHQSGTHSFCTGTELGDLAMKRWSMSSVQNPSLESAPALLGPRLVDGDCVSNFDNKWSAQLVKGDTSTDSMRALSAALDACNRQVPFDMMRP